MTNRMTNRLPESKPCAWKPKKPTFTPLCIYYHTASFQYSAQILLPQATVRSDQRLFWGRTGAGLGVVLGSIRERYGSRRVELGNYSGTTRA